MQTQDLESFYLDQVEQGESAEYLNKKLQLAFFFRNENEVIIGEDKLLRGTYHNN